MYVSFKNFTEGVRYRISFFSLPKQLLKIPVQTFKASYGPPLYLIHNGTLKSNKWTITLKRSKVSLTKSDSIV